MSETTVVPAPPTTSFEVYVSKDTFKFTAAHFVAFAGYRERLHGHNYRVGVRLLGQRQIGADGYVIDFGCIKKVCKDVCKRLNEHFICPVHSNVLQITVTNESVRIECEDSSVFVFPRQDCALLPIVHATTEELAIYLWAEILKGLHAGYLSQRGIHTMEVTVAEAIGQEATFRWAVPLDGGADFVMDVRSFIVDGDVVPMPCPSERQQASSCPNCAHNSTNFSAQLERIAQAINTGKIKTTSTESVSVQDLKQIVNNEN